MAQGGRGLARIDGKVIFVEGALPGELVEIEMLRTRKDFGEARLVRVQEAHSERVVPACPHYNRCGGCNLQHASIGLQRELKRQVVEDLFRRMAKTTLPQDWVIQGGNPWKYRRRARFVQGKKGLGFHQENSHNVEVISECPVLCDPLQTLLSQASRVAVGEELQAFADSLDAVGLWNRDFTDAQLSTQKVDIMNRSIVCDARVFFQSNLELVPSLVQSVLRIVDTCVYPKLAVDLFSGVGVFAKFLQEHFAKVIAVEWNPGCLVHARKNVGENCEFISSSAEDYLAKLDVHSIDLLVVDPPRAGLSPEVRKALLQARPQRIAYVSCDPVTLARDVGEFVRNGWELKSAEGFDFYPQTDHLEMLVVLSPSVT